MITDFLSYLLSLETKGIKLGLDRTHNILSACGNPHHKIKTVQVVGTNGKGSTSAIIANIYNRLYSSNIYNDALHRTRTHIDSNISLWYKFFISELKNKIQFTYRMRSTDSIFDWVEDLKSFKRYYLTYTIYLNKIEL